MPVFLLLLYISLLAYLVQQTAHENDMKVCQLSHSFEVCTKVLGDE